MRSSEAKANPPSRPCRGAYVDHVSQTVALGESVGLSPGFPRAVGPYLQPDRPGSCCRITNPSMSGILSADTAFQQSVTFGIGEAVANFVFSGIPACLRLYVTDSGVTVAHGLIAHTTLHFTTHRRR
jgi:hypothetical protein